MASGSDIRAGGAYVELSARDEKLQQGLEHAERRLKSLARTFHHFGEGLALAGGAILGPLGLAMHFLEKGKMSEGAAGDTARALAEEWEKLEGAILHVAGKIGAALLPVIRQAVEKGRDWAITIGRIIEQNQGLVVTAAKVGAGLLAAGTAFLALGKALRFASGALGVVQLGLGLLTSPAGLAVVAIGLVAAGLGYLWSQTEEGRDTIASLKEDWSTAWSGIVTEIKNGRLDKAFEILWTAVELSFRRMLVSMRTAFDEWVNQMVSGNKETGGGLGGFLHKIGAMFAMTGAVFAAFWKHPDDRAARDQYIKARRRELLEEVNQMEQELDRMAKESKVYGDPKIKELEARLKALKADADKTAEDVARKMAKVNLRLDPFLISAKGTLSPYALGQSFGIGDNDIGKRLVELTEQQREFTEENRDFLKSIDQGIRDLRPVTQRYA
jgi:hypothetical protein